MIWDSVKQVCKVSDAETKVDRRRYTFQIQAKGEIDVT